MYDILLFDLDGTLTDPKEGITRCVNHALKSFGRGVEDLDTLRCFIGPPLWDQFMEFCGFTKEQADLAVEKYRERYRDIGIFENRVYPGIREMLSRLQAQGKTIALATSKPEVFARRILEKYDLLPFFTLVVGSELDGTRVEKVQVIEEVLRQLKLSHGAPNAVMIGDRKHDILGAKACGLASIGVRFGYAEPGELEAAGADEIAATVEELEGLLAG